MIKPKTAIKMYVGRSIDQSGFKGTIVGAEINGALSRFMPPPSSNSNIENANGPSSKNENWLDPLFQIGIDVCDFLAGPSSQKSR
jgi:hypothetical protein